MFFDILSWDGDLNDDFLISWISNKKGEDEEDTEGEEKEEWEEEEDELERKTMVLET